MKQKNTLKEYTKLPFIGAGFVGLLALFPIISYLFIIIDSLVRSEYDMLGMILFIFTPIILVQIGIIGAIGGAVFFTISFSFSRSKIERLFIQIAVGLAVIAIIYLYGHWLNYFIELILAMTNLSPEESLKWVDITQKSYFIGPILIIFGGFYDFFVEKN